MRSYAFSREWLTLYNYEKGIFGYQSASHDPKFFFSARGERDPLAELKSAIAAFQGNKKWGHLNLSAPCTFPARYKRLSEKWPALFKHGPRCAAFEKWKKSLDAQGLSVLYVGSYTSNPASMFGHTLFRLKRGSGNWLLDYTVAFLARTDPGDNSLTYGYKGITGGYLGLYNLEPYYINAAKYSSLEKRDIWEYEINLGQDELDFFLRHLFELSLNTGFDYYFLGKNCSYYLLTLLRATAPRFQPDKLDWLVHPVEVTKLLGEENQGFIFRPALDKKMNQKARMLGVKGKKRLKEILADPNLIAQEGNPLILDYLSDYYKSLNYKNFNNLSSRDSFGLKETFKRRAQIKQVVSYPVITTSVDPLETHDPGRVKLSYGSDNKEDFSQLDWDWGYHGPDDNEAGLIRTSFIDYFGFGLRYDLDREDLKLEEIRLINILGLNPLTPIIPQLSWQVISGINDRCFRCQEKKNLIIGGGLGLAQRASFVSTWQLMNLEFSGRKKTQRLVANIEAGAKAFWKEHMLSFRLWGYFFEKSLSPVYQGAYHFYFSPDSSLFSHYFYSKHNQDEQYSLGLKYHY